MTAPYTNDEMPPEIHRVATDEYELRGQSGVVFGTITQASVQHPDDWWSDLVDAMQTRYSTPNDAIHDLTLLTVRRDWSYIDDR